MGHEFTGTVAALGSAVTTLAVGDPVVSPFTVSCGACFYCAAGFSSRCEACLLFGCPLLDGAQAAYVRVPLAESTVVRAPPGLDGAKLCLMADIFPTGVFAADNGLAALPDPKGAVVVLVGCGPVGLCALVAASEYAPRALLAVDGVPERLSKAAELGAEPWNYLTDREGLEARVRELTDGRGADVVIEVVGHSSALDMAFTLLRPWGTISSVGVHNGEIPWTGNQAYGKNLTIKMGRCPVRSQSLLTCLLMPPTCSHIPGIFPRALDLLEKKQHLFEYALSPFTVLP